LKCRLVVIVPFPLIGPLWHPLSRSRRVLAQHGLHRARYDSLPISRAG
jgi:hypothetical protein